MKTMLKPLTAACLAALTVSAQAAITQSPQTRVEQVDVVVDRDVVIELRFCGPVIHVEKLAAAPEGPPRREVRVFTNSDRTSRVDGRNGYRCPGVQRDVGSLCRWCGVARQRA